MPDDARYLDALVSETEPGNRLIAICDRCSRTEPIIALITFLLGPVNEADAICAACYADILRFKVGDVV